MAKTKRAKHEASSTPTSTDAAVLIAELESSLERAAELAAELREPALAQLIAAVHAVVERGEVTTLENTDRITRGLRTWVESAIGRRVVLVLGNRMAHTFPGGTLRDAIDQSLFKLRWSRRTERNSAAAVCEMIVAWGLDSGDAPASRAEELLAGRWRGPKAKKRTAEGYTRAWLRTLGFSDAAARKKVENALDRRRRST